MDTEARFWKARRNLIIISVVLIVFDVGSINGNGTYAGVSMELNRPEIVKWTAWVAFSGFRIRYLQTLLYTQGKVLRLIRNEYHASLVKRLLGSAGLGQDVVGQYREPAQYFLSRGKGIQFSLRLNPELDEKGNYTSESKDGPVSLLRVIYCGLLSGVETFIVQTRFTDYIVPILIALVAAGFNLTLRGL